MKNRQDLKTETSEGIISNKNVKSDKDNNKTTDHPGNSRPHSPLKRI